MSTQLERLRALREQRDPMLAMQRLMHERAMAEAIGKMEMMKGDKPVKGVDYFTPDEINGIVSYIQSQIRVPRDGVQGTVGPKGSDGKHGRHGETPTRGIDYWTSQDVEKIIAEVVRRVPKPEAPPKIEDITTHLRKTPVKYSDIMDAPDLTDLPKLIAFLKAGGFRGGGGSSTSTSASPTIPTGTVNGSNLTFTAATTPTIVFTEGGTFTNGFGVTITGLSIVFAAGLAPQQWVYYI